MKVTKFKGVNNVADQTALTLGNRGVMELREGVNVDIDNDSKLSRRDGYALKTAGNVTHLWSKGEYCFYVRDSNLYRYTGTEELLLTNINNVSYCLVNDVAYISTGSSTYIYDSSFRNITLDAPTISAVGITDGPLPAGKYNFAITKVSDGGYESAVSKVNNPVTVSLASTFTVTVSVASEQQNVYMTTTDGDTFYLVGTIPIGDTTLIITRSTSTIPLAILDTECLAGGDNYTAFNGRIYFSIDNALFYTDAYNPRVYSPASNFFLFPTDITEVVAVDTGLYVSADKTYALRGLDPEEAVLEEVDPLPIITGTATTTVEFTLQDVDTSGTQAVWRTNEGVVLGLNSGNIYKLSKEVLATQAFISGASLIKKVEGKTQLLSSLAPANEVNSFGASDSIVAEVRRNGIIIT